jgi:hypothetical protein
MSWAFDFDEDDSFVPGDFGEGFLDQQYGEGRAAEPEETRSFFYLPPQPHIVPEAKVCSDSQGLPVSVECNKGCGSRDGRSLASENAELRQTAMTLKERFTQIASLNEHLKSQLEECQDKFKNLMFSGFTNSRK